MPSSTNHVVPLSPVIRDRLAVASLTLVALLVRLVGIDFGLPHQHIRPDELYVIRTALITLRDGSPGTFDYPMVFMNVVALALGAYYAIGRLWRFESPDAFVAEWYVDATNFFVISRALSALAGALTVPAVYVLAARLFGRRAALLSALLLTFAYLHVRDSHFATTDVALTLACTLALGAIVAAWTRGRRREFALAALLSGLAISTKYNAAPLVPALAVAAFGVALRSAPGRRLGVLTALGSISTLGGVFGFLIGTPYLLWDFDMFVQDFAKLTADKLGVEGVGHDGIYVGMGWSRQLFPNLWYGVGWPILLGALIGVAVLARAPRPEALPVLVFLFAYYLQVGGSEIVFVRYALPVVPLLCSLAAFGATRLVEQVSARLQKPALAGAAFGLVALPAYDSVHFNRLLMQRDARLELGDWLERHVPSGAVIGFVGEKALHPELWSVPDQVARGRALFTREHGGEGKGFRALEEFARKSQKPSYIVARTQKGKQGFFDRFTDEPLREPPVIVVVADYPAFERYLRVGASPLLEQSLANDYRLIETRKTWREGELVFDPQDLFVLPYDGLSNVERPGPGYRVYARKTAAAQSTN